MNFKSCEFFPLLDPLDLPNGQETPVWALIPFPPLHTVIIGPVNHVEKSLMDVCDVEGYECVWSHVPRENPEENPVRCFEKLVGIHKSDYHGKQMEGNQCQDMIKEKNLEKLKELLLLDNMPEKLVDNYIKCLTDIRKVYSACCRKNLDPNHRDIINELNLAWTALVEDHRVNLTIPNKIHFTVDHFSDYFEDPLTGGEGLGTTTDQIIEHMHSYIDRTFKRSKYWVNDPTTTACATKQHQCILQINAFSVRMK